MPNLIRQYPLGFIAAVAVHIIIALMFYLHIDKDEPIKPAAKPKTMEVASIAQEFQEQLKEKEVQRLRDIEQAKKKEIEHQEKIAEDKKQKDIAKKNKLAEDKKREEQAFRLKVEKEKKQKEAAQKKKLAEEQKKQAAEKKRKEKLARDQKKKTAEKRKRDLAKKQQKEATKRRQAELDQQLQEELALEQQTQDQKELARYVARISATIKQNGRKTAAKKGLSCTLEVKLIPGGEVVSVRTVKSSGDPLFDRSVELAIYKSSPLPVPKDKRLFEHFRKLTFVYVP